jgi:hypothetical protein
MMVRRTQLLCSRLQSCSRGCVRQISSARAIDAGECPRLIKTIEYDPPFAFGIHKFCKIDGGRNKLTSLRHIQVQRPEQFLD